jgi:hypothetical protein
MLQVRCMSSLRVHRYDVYFMSVPGTFVATYCDKTAPFRIVEREEKAVASLRYSKQAMTV